MRNKQRPTGHNSETRKYIMKTASFKPLLENLSAENLSATAKALGVKTGKSKKATIENLIKAGDAGAANLKVQFTVSFRPTDGSAKRVTYLGANFRNYTSGPGENDLVWLTPDAAVPGSPLDSAPE